MLHSSRAKPDERDSREASFFGACGYMKLLSDFPVVPGIFSQGEAVCNLYFSMAG